MVTLEDVLDFVDGNGTVVTDFEMVDELLRNEMGLEMEKSYVITQEQKALLKNSLTALQVLALSAADEFLKNLAEKALESLEE